MQNYTKIFQKRIFIKTIKFVTMKTLAERLRHLRVQKDLNQSELARLAGIKPQIVQLIEAGKVLQSKHLFALAHVLETSAEWLLTGSHDGASFSTAVQVSKHGIKIARLEEKSRSKAQVPPTRPHTVDEIPIYSASGNGKNSVFSLDLTRAIGYAAAHPKQQRMNGAFAFYCVGESMSPRYDHGDLVYCLPNQPLRAGEDVLVTLINNHDAMMGRLIKHDRTGQKLTFEQFQPSEKQSVSLKEVIEIYLIVGRG